MTALVSALLFVGYLLVYAAVANGGKFATRPWDAMLGSAYPGESAAGGGSPASTVLGVVGDVIGSTGSTVRDRSNLAAPTAADTFHHRPNS